jgi:hypothetical protein
MKTFISYSTAHDQIIALRLQTLAAVSGMTVYVPPATSRNVWNGVLVPEVQKELRESDVILAVILENPAPSAVAEMNFAITTAKLLIPIVGPLVPLQYYAQFRPHFVVNPIDPSETERQIVQFLAGKQQGEAVKAGLLLGTLAVALLLMLASESK